MHLEIKHNNNAAKSAMLALLDPGPRTSMAWFKDPNLKNISSCRALNFIQGAPKSRLRQHKSHPEVADTWLCIMHSLLSNPEMYGAVLELN